MGVEPTGLSALKKVEAILANPAIYQLGELIPGPDPLKGGRPRDYPAWTLIFWGLIRDLVHIEVVIAEDGGLTVTDTVREADLPVPMRI